MVWTLTINLTLTPALTLNPNNSNTHLKPNPFDADPVPLHPYPILVLLPLVMWLSLDSDRSNPNPTRIGSEQNMTCVRFCSATHSEQVSWKKRNCAVWFSKTVATSTQSWNRHPLPWSPPAEDLFRCREYSHWRLLSVTCSRANPPPPPFPPFPAPKGRTLALWGPEWRGGVSFHGLAGVMLYGGKRDATPGMEKDWRLSVEWSTSRLIVSIWFDHIECVREDTKCAIPATIHAKNILYILHRLQAFCFKHIFCFESESFCRMGHAQCMSNTRWK
jgi:hypothetical protein